jgi:hypothetical protein
MRQDKILSHIFMRAVFYFILPKSSPQHALELTGCSRGNLSRNKVTHKSALAFLGARRLMDNFFLPPI